MYGSRLTRTLWSGEVQGGQAVQVSWDGRSDGGRRAGEGVYFARLELGFSTATLRIVSLR